MQKPITRESALAILARLKNDHRVLSVAGTYHLQDVHTVTVQGDNLVLKGNVLGDVLFEKKANVEALTYATTTESKEKQKLLKAFYTKGIGIGSASFALSAPRGGTSTPVKPEKEVDKKPQKPTEPPKEEKEPTTPVEPPKEDKEKEPPAPTEPPKEEVQEVETVITYVDAQDREVGTETIRSKPDAVISTFNLPKAEKGRYEIKEGTTVQAGKPARVRVLHRIDASTLTPAIKAKKETKNLVALPEAGLDAGHTYLPGTYRGISDQTFTYRRVEVAVDIDEQGKIRAYMPSDGIFEDDGPYKYGAYQVLSVINGNQKPLDTAGVLHTHYTLLRTMGKALEGLPLHYTSKENLEKVRERMSEYVHVPDNFVEENQGSTRKIDALANDIARQYLKSEAPGNRPLYHQVVDSVTGATFTAHGAADALAKALRQAEKADSVKKLSWKTMPPARITPDASLDLSQVAVEVVRNNGNKEDVAYADFAEKSLVLEVLDPATRQVINLDDINLNDYLGKGLLFRVRETNTDAMTENHLLLVEKPKHDLEAIHFQIEGDATWYTLGELARTKRGHLYADQTLHLKQADKGKGIALAFISTLEHATLQGKVEGSSEGNLGTVLHPDGSDAFSITITEKAKGKLYSLYTVQVVYDADSYTPAQ